MTSLDDFQQQLPATMLADRFRLRRRLEEIERDAAKGKPVERSLAKLEEELCRSVTAAAGRRARLPTIHYDEELPVCQRREDIARAIRENQVVVVCGETGSGKSTQLPKICLELGRGVVGMIGHTQPRRIAARSVAARVAEELGTSLGEHVGFKVRFADSTSANTLVKVMTDGILLAETQSDPFFEQYDTIILDEAHERSLNVDFLIGYGKRLLAKRPELKLIVTSATLDPERFARHFATPDGPAPVIEVTGRTWPVEVRYRPLVDEEEGEGEGEERDWPDGLCDAVDELARIDTGDVLVFLPTERDIHEAAKVLRGYTLPRDDSARRTEILPLYARLPAAQQQRIFSRHAHRRIVLATNVAESSLTVPGIRYVIDVGTARVSRYSARSKTQRLPIEPISRASADQRAGRCGRLGPGVCVRLYAEDDYLKRDRFTAPEIQRSNLAAVVLQAMSLSLGNLERFPFLDPPKRAAIRDGVKTLFELGAIDERQRLTPLGRRLAQLPVDPRIGRMILAADEEGCLAEVLVIASALEIRDPRDRPVEHHEAADEAHAQFAHQESDFLTYLEMWDFYHRLKENLSRGQLRKACRQNFLSYNRMREWTDIYRQLIELVRQAGMKTRRRRDEYGPVHRAVLTGLLANVANRTGTFEYMAAGGGQFFLWPGSALFKKNPKWVVAAEMVETAKRYLRCCARIDPDWIEPLAGHLVKRTYSEPHWDAASGSAMAFERVSLFGLVVVPRRRVALGPLDPATARELLIRHGLVEGQLPRPPAFLRHNQELAAEVERLQDKLRRRDLLRGEWAKVEFYDERIPEDVFDAARLEGWRREAERESPRLLYMTKSDLMEEEPEVAPGDFPDRVEAGRLELPVEYRFEPGAEDDGLSVEVPLEAVNQLDAGRLGWLVPGMMEQKVTALIKTLPKPLRQRLVPAPDTARVVVGKLPFGEGDVLAALATELQRIAGAPVSPADFQLDKLPDELRMNVRVVDAEGRALAQGRDLAGLREQLGRKVPESLAAVEDSHFHRDELTTWDFDELPREVEVQSRGLALRGYPMLVDRRESVSMRLADSPDRAQAETRRGAARLFLLTANREIRSQLGWFPDMEQMLLHAATIPDFDLGDELAELIAFRAFKFDEEVPRTREQFDQRASAARERIGLAVQDAAELLPRLFAAYHEARLALEDFSMAPRWQYAVDDVREQLTRLVRPGFLVDTPWTWLMHFPRYLRAIAVRFDRLRGGGGRRDRESTDLVRAHWQLYQQQAARNEDTGTRDPELAHFRWMLEEYRVSLFAQTLGTAVPVSEKRLERQWEKVYPTGRPAS